MRKFLTFLSKTIAVIFAILFVITAVLVILLFNIERKLFDADLYKSALADQQIYERLPGIVGNLLTTSISYNPCAENPLLCEDIPDELRACYIQKLGQERYVALASGQEQPTEADLQNTQSCRDQYGQQPEQPAMKQNMLLLGPSELVGCYKQALGDEFYQTLAHDERHPTEAEFISLTPCMPKIPSDINPFSYASPELQTCTRDALGEDVYNEISSNKRPPTDPEMTQMASCFARLGFPSIETPASQGTSENPLLTAPPDVQACVKQAIGEQAYDELYNNKRPPTETEIQQITPCFGQLGSQGGGQEGGMPPFMQNLKASDWEAIIKILMPPDELQTITENTLDQLFAYLDGKTNRVSVSLMKLKERLAGQAGKDAIRQLIAAQPPCTEEQLAQMSAGKLGGEQGMVICKPPEEALAVMLPELQTQVNALVTDMPDETMIIKPSTPSAPVSGSGPLGNDPLTVLRTVRLGLRLSPLLPLGLLLLVTLFGVRSLKGWLRWWGIPFFFAGAIALAPGITILPALNWAWNNYVTSRIPPYLPTDVVSIGHDLASYLLRSLSGQITLQAGILAAIGLAAWIGSSFIKTRRKESTTAATPPPESLM